MREIKRGCEDMVKSQNTLTGKIEHLRAAGDDLTAFSDALARGVLLHCRGERSDGVGAGLPDVGRPKPSSQLVVGANAAMMLTIRLEQLQSTVGDTVSLVEISHLESIVVQWRTHLEDGDESIWDCGTE